MAMTLAFLLVVLAVAWMITSARPQPVRVRRNLTPQEIAALRQRERDDI
jgi:hypothetical protein